MRSVSGEHRGRLTTSSCGCGLVDFFGLSNILKVNKCTSKNMTGFLVFDRILSRRASTVTVVILLLPTLTLTLPRL